MRILSVKQLSVENLIDLAVALTVCLAIIVVLIIICVVSYSVEQKETLPDGSIKIKRITIEGVGEKGTLLTVKKHFKTLLALIKLYEDAGRPEKVTFGIHQLAETLDLSWGRTTYKYLKEALEGLRKIPLTFENTFIINKQATP